MTIPSNLRAITTYGRGAENGVDREDSDEDENGKNAEESWRSSADRRANPRIPGKMKIGAGVMKNLKAHRSRVPTMVRRHEGYASNSKHFLK